MNTASSRLERQALRRARAKLGWYAHATVYGVVNLALIGLSLAGGGRWAIFPLLGWGIGLAAHAASVWLLPRDGLLMQRMVERERSRLVADASRGDPW